MSVVAYLRIMMLLIRKSRINVLPDDVVLIAFDFPRALELADPRTSIGPGFQCENEAARLAGVKSHEHQFALVARRLIEGEHWHVKQKISKATAQG